MSKLPLCYWKLTGFISFYLFSFFSFATVEVADIQVTKTYYSTKVLTAKFNYDGSLGDSVFFGAIAETNDAVSGAGFHPYRVGKGTTELTFTVKRPENNSIDALESQAITFTFYNRQRSVKKTLNIELSWPSLVDHFDINNELKSDFLFTSIKQISIDENMPNSGQLIRQFVASGISASDIKPIYIEQYSSMKPKPNFVFAETISVADFSHFSSLLKTNDIAFENISFISIDSSEFNVGQAELMPLGNIHSSAVNQDDIDRVIKEKSFSSLFNKIGFPGTTKQSLNKKLLSKAVHLNDLAGKTNGLAAKEIAEYLIDSGYQGDRVYAELARAYGRIHRYNSTAIKKRRSILNLALSLNPENQWAHALLIFDETNLGNFASAEKHARLAQKYEKEKNIWVIVNWGRLYEQQGRLDEAKAKYKELLGQKNLSQSNQVAHTRGLQYYVNVLELTGDKEVVAVYRELITQYPSEQACTKIKLAHNIVINEPSYSEARSLLSDKTITGCEYFGATQTLVKLRDWYESESSTSLQSLVIEHGDLTTLIYEAASMPDSKGLLKQLEDNNLSLGVTNQDGLNALHLAVASKNKRAITTLLETNFDVNQQLPNGWTPLMIATYVNAPDVVELLLTNGADKSVKGFDGYSALNIATQGGFQEIVSLLESENL